MLAGRRRGDKHAVMPPLPTPTLSPSPRQVTSNGNLKVFLCAFQDRGDAGRQVFMEFWGCQGR